MKVSGPYIEYLCHRCGHQVSEKVRLDTVSIKRRMDEIRENDRTAMCAHCAGNLPSTPPRDDMDSKDD